MKRKSLSKSHKILFLAALLVLAGVFSWMGNSFADESGPAANVHEIETTVIHVDQYSVYAPNLIFYFDTHMEKRKKESLMKTADRLLNKKAVITYSSKGDLSQDKHPLLVGIVPADEKPIASSPKEPRRVSPEFAGGAPEKPVKNPSGEQTAPKVDESAAPQVSSKQTVFQEKKEPRMPAQSQTISRDEVTAFVRRLLELNEKKDLSAVMPFYADKVDYYDRGVVDRDYIRRDLGYYFKNWDKISTSLDGDVVMIVLDQPDIRVAKFTTAFSVQNDKKSSMGKTENIWKLQRVNGQLKLIDVKQKIIERQSSAF